MNVSDLMSKSAVPSRPEMTLAAAGALMWQNDCGLLPIVNDTGKVTGVITDSATNPAHAPAVDAVAQRNRLQEA